MQIYKDMAEIDTIADRSGGYVDFVLTQEAHYDYRKLLKYCNDKNISPLDLDEEEKKQFLI